LPREHCHNVRLVANDNSFIPTAEILTGELDSVHSDFTIHRTEQ